MTPICATFSDFRLVKGRKVCQLVCEVPLEQADAALIALGGLPNPHAERWVGIVPLKAQPTGHELVGSAPSPSLADAADSPAAAPMSPLHKAIAHLYEDGGSTEREAEIYPSDPRPARQTLQAQARGAAEPATTPGSSSGRTAEFGSANGGSNPSPGTKLKRYWGDCSPSQQAGMMCGKLEFQEWMRARGGYGKLPDDASPSDLVRLWLYDELGINSRADLDTNPEAAKRWRELYGMFQIDTRYSDAAR